MNSFFLETACISLIACGVWHGDQTTIRDSIKVGVHCLEDLQYQKVAAQRLSGVKKAMEQSGLIMQ